MDRTEQRGDFDKWCDAGFPGHRDDFGEAAAIELAKTLIAQSKIFHSVITKAVQKADKQLDGDKLDELQSWLEAHLHDLVSDCKGCALQAADLDNVSDAHLRTPDFTTLTLEVRAASNLKSKSDFASTSVIAAGDK